MVYIVAQRDESARLKAACKEEHVKYSLEVESRAGAEGVMKNIAKGTAVQGLSH